MDGLSEEQFVLTKIRMCVLALFRKKWKGADSCPNKTAVDEEELIQVLQEYFNRVLQQKISIDYVVKEFQRVYKAKDENAEYEKELNLQIARLQRMRQKYMDM